MSSAVFNVHGMDYSGDENSTDPSDSEDECGDEGINIDSNGLESEQDNKQKENFYKRNVIKNSATEQQRRRLLKRLEENSSVIRKENNEVEFKNIQQEERFKKWKEVYEKRKIISDINEETSNLILIRFLSKDQKLLRDEQYLSIKDIASINIHHEVKAELSKIFALRNEILCEKNFKDPSTLNRNPVDTYLITIQKTGSYDKETLFGNKYEKHECTISLFENCTYQNGSVIPNPSTNKRPTREKITYFSQNNGNTLPQFLLWCSVVASATCLHLCTPMIKNYFNILMI